MKLQNLSTRTFVRLIVEGASLTTILLLFLLYVFTKDIRVILGGFSVMILLFFWGVIFLHYFQKKLSVFTDGLCRTLDEMMDSTVRPQINYEAETLLARISHRLERLYRVMQETRHKVEEEKAELQSLVSDISHQTKTPIANLKMLNDTMLTRKISEETRKEFLHATASQLDKLDFLIQGNGENITIGNWCDHLGKERNSYCGYTCRCDKWGSCSYGKKASSFIRKLS